jgi:heme-degrading monooxygenase HmoA
MIAYLYQCDVNPAKLDVYTQWHKMAVPRLKAGPGLAEMRVYQPATGSAQLVVISEFPDLNAWQTWWSDEDVQNVLVEARGYHLNISTALWHQVSRETKA